jgi:flagellar hook assembly protein FlgD
MRQNQIGGDGYVRFQYNTRAAARVTVKVFDFAMELVATVIDGEYRTGPAECAELWNGRNDYGDLVANGAYFYSLEIEGDGTYWGKVLIIN